MFHVSVVPRLRHAREFRTGDRFRVGAAVGRRHNGIIVAPDKAVSYAIVNAGGFTGLTKHNVAIPVSQLKLVDNKLVLAGATKEALKATPPFEYAN